MAEKEDRNKTLVLEAFEVLFNKRDYAAAQGYWADEYIQHSAHIPPGRDGLFDLIRTMPDTFKHETEHLVGEGDFVFVRGRFTGHGLPKPWIVVDTVRIEDGRLKEHWDVVEDEASRAESISGLPMYGDSFPDDAGQ